MNAISLTQEWCIYKILNPEGQIYIGRTNDFERRKNTHLREKAPKYGLLKLSFQKFKKEAHRVEIIESFYGSEDAANEKEIFWIKMYGSNANRFPALKGLNSTDGGAAIKGYKHTDETKEKIRASNAGKVRSPLVVQRMSEFMMGKKKTKEEAIRVGIAHMKPVLQYDLNGEFIREFPSARFAYFALRGKWRNYSPVADAAKGKRPSYMGFIFKYKKS